MLNSHGNGVTLELDDAARNWIAARGYDLHGRLVRTLNDAAGVAGHYQLSWDGRRNSGALATPGRYLFHLQISGDSSTRTLIRSIGLSY